MSDTPRTAAIAFSVQLKAAVAMMQPLQELVDLACQLERELAAARARNDELVALLRQARQGALDWNDERIDRALEGEACS
jgi:hypothetical protein